MTQRTNGIKGPISKQQQQNPQSMKQTREQNKNNRNSNNMDTLRMKEKYLQIPVDYNSTSFTDFGGLMTKQRSLLSDNTNDINLNDNTFFSRFKLLIGPKTATINYNHNTNPRAMDKSLPTVDEEEKRFEEDVETESTISSKIAMENNKPSQDYIRRFWMSDKNCGQCSECGATFHTFRRKHHCRLCGRVFCQTCCSERININKFKKLKNYYTKLNKEMDDKNSAQSNGNNATNGSMIRVCVFCSKLQTNDRLLGIAVTYPNNMNKKQLEMQESKYDETMNQIYDFHMKYVIKQLCRFEKLNKEWFDLIYAFSKRANDTVFPDILSSGHDFNDIRHYIKVKRIQGGTISQCQFIDGVILRKNVAHRKMRVDIENPSILLLDQAIEYHRMNSKFHSFDILLKQNEEYMRMIVNKICDLGPDIVIVSNQVSRLAVKEMMLENITLISNIESSSMERIARAIRAPIIGSIDHINQLDAKYALGHCGRFYIKYYNCDPNGNKGRRTPLLFFDKCPGSNGHGHSTILLRGDKKPNLLKVKNVIRLAMHTLYHLNLEKSYLNNFDLQLIANAADNYKDIQSDNEKHLFLSTSPFISSFGWRRENVIHKLKRLHLNKENDRFPHLQTYPYNHHGIGDNVNELGIWDPFLPNTDNPWICQTLLVNHCRVVTHLPQQCFPPKLKLIDFYTELDISLGHYLHRLFRCEACPNNRCKESLSAHALTYSHYNKTITIRLIHYQNQSQFIEHHVHAYDGKIVMWSKCKKCKKSALNMRVMNDRTFFLSFGKFLEMEFYALPPVISSCKHKGNMVKCFGWNDETNNTGDMVIEIDNIIKQPYTVFTAANITTACTKNDAGGLQFKYYTNELNILELVSKYTFAAFLVKIDELIGLIGNYDIITKDLHKLRQEVNDECEQIATQFIDHRDYLYICKTKRVDKANTIAFLNRKRYHLYRISSEWNEVLDGLRGLFVPNNQSSTTIDNANRWMKKFKAPFKGLRATLNTTNIRDEFEENDKLLVSALQEVDNQIANAVAAVRGDNSSGDNTPNNMALLRKTKSANNIFANDNEIYDNNDDENGNKSFSNLLGLQSRKQTNADFEHIIDVISPRMRDVSFMVDFNAMFEEHLTQNPLNKANQNNPYNMSLKIPNAFAVEQKYNNLDADEIKQERIATITPPMHEGISPYKSFGFAGNSPNNDKSSNHKLGLPAKPKQLDAATSGSSGQSSSSYLTMSPKNTTSVPISTTLFPNADTNAKSTKNTKNKNIIITNNNMPITMQNVTLNDVDMERLKAESLFLVSACLENSCDIGSNPNYAHLNLPKCFNQTIIPIYCDEPSAVIAYTLSSLEYHCLMNNIPTENIRSCRQRGDPSVKELENMVKQRQINKRLKIKTELQIRSKSNHGKLYTNKQSQSKSQTELEQKISDINMADLEKQIDNEIDLDDLLHHIPKLKHVSKMEYLDEKKEYQLQLKKHGMKSSTKGGDINIATDMDNTQNNNPHHNHHKFKFVDPGHFVEDNSFKTLQQQQQMEGNNTTNTEEITYDTYPNNNYPKSTYVSTTFSCHVYYPHQFRALRRRLYADKQDFIESLSRCQSWNTSGGKSGSTFKKTLDHRFVLKFVKQNEFRMFLDNAQSYFEHMASVLFKNYPSVLVHILGVYQISWNKSNSSKSNKFGKYVIVMPNLWYGKNITKQFDLKGSLRNRYVGQDKIDRHKKQKLATGNTIFTSRTVMLDKNFIEYMKGFPMTLEDQSKQHLHKAVHNDTLFLCRSDVIDYSLLVGINDCDGNNELVVGIIDYLRTYTWDKAVEEQEKSIGMVIGKQAPTITSPKNYKQRFREAMERYFMVSPDRKSKRINRPKDKGLTDAVKDILIHC